MLFADLLFLFLFLPLCVASYFFTKKTQYRNIVLIVFSMIFYAWGEPTRILLLLSSVAVNYILAIMIENYNKKGNTKAAKLAFAAALIFDIGMLGIFKYTDFMINNVNAIFRTSIPLANIALPLGISFYTFQILSYVIDVYWEKVDAQRSFHKLFMYISLFPQLVAGPIVRYSTIAEEIDNRRSTLADVSEGATRMIMGLSKKVLIANNLNLMVTECFGADITGASVVGTWLGVIAYSMQVYFDFSGYSDIAIGIGRMFGFHFDENFNYPFICRSISEFWQRWHISLSTFFRDYLFCVPIFGKRRPIASLFLVWFTTGLWHGASWNYVLWGLYFGVFLFIEVKIGKKRLKKTPTVIMQLYSKLVIILGFGIFRFENMGDLGNFFKNLVGLNGNAFINEQTQNAFLSYVFLFIVALIACFPVAQSLKKLIKTCSYNVQATMQVLQTVYTVLLVLGCTAVLVDTFATNNPFLYWIF